MSWIAKIILFFGILSSTYTYSFFKPLPDAKDLEFSLLTVDVGTGLEQRFGHTILRVTDTKNDRDFLLNWGTFDFNDPNFIWNFVRAKLRYWVAQSDLESTLAFYRDYENRSVVQEKLNLTLQQKQRLAELLAFKLQPKEKYFWYNFFYKNCSTIPRDLLNEVLGDQIAHAAHAWPAKVKLREQVRQSLNEWPIVGFFSDLMMNSETDQNIDAWVEMFHPLFLREHLLRLPQFDDNARPIPGTKLLTDTRPMVQGGDYPSSPVNLFHWFFAVGLIILVLSFALSFKFTKLSNGLLKLFSVLWGPLTGTIGLILFLGWVISDYSCLHHNANLWLFWPTDFAFIVLAWRFPNLGRFAKSYVWAHVLALLFCAVFYSFGAFEQDLANSIKFLSPLLGLYAYLLLSPRYAKKSYNTGEGAFSR